MRMFVCLYFLWYVLVFFGVSWFALVCGCLLARLCWFVVCCFVLCLLDLLVCLFGWLVVFV